MHLRIFAVGLLCTLGAASTASAQGYGLLGSSGDVVIGAERLFGYLSTTATTDTPAGNEMKASSSQFSLFASSSDSPYATPRVALDGFVSESLSLGVTLGLINESTETETTSMAGVSTTQPGPDGFGVVAGARVGYAHMFSDTAGIWPHLGITYFSASVESNDGDEQGLSGLALSLDAMLVVTPVQHFGFGIGPILDLGLTGTGESTPNGGATTETDATITDWGIQAGLFGWL